MAQTLRDFIDARETEVRLQIKTLNDELRELRAAKSAIEGSLSSRADGHNVERLTHRDMIVQVLDENPEGGTSDRVIEMVRKRFGVDIPQASMSSQLSRAKSDNLLDLEQGTKIWRLATSSHLKNEPPSGGSSSGEGDASSPKHTEAIQGIPSANNPDPAGQTQHRKMPGM